MTGLIAWFCLLTFFGVVSLVLVLWELVLFYEKGMEFKGRIYSNYSRRMKWQQIDHFILSHWYSGVVVGKASW